MVRAYLFLSLFISFTFFCALSALLGTLLDASGRVFSAHARFWGRYTGQAERCRASPFRAGHFHE